METHAPVIGITCGDTAGVGPEVVRAALASGRLDGDFTYRLIGDFDAGTPGAPDAASSRAALEALEESVALWRAGKISAVATGPVSKERLAALGYPFPGQTEFFADRCGVSNYAMCLTGPRLTVGLVTIHEPLARVPDLITREEITRTGLLLVDFCLRRGIAAPRIAVAGLNPHAGEGGRIGREELEIISPAVEDLRAAAPGVRFSGPLPPDTVFHHAVKGEYDAVLCMYHDQGLIPLKLLDFDEGVNITLGLPLIRTSPDHGTAFDIAGKGIARAQSMTAAIRLAADLARGTALRRGDSPPTGEG